MKLQVGDKIASQSAQKGTDSISMNLADMPFTYKGQVPDIIFNPVGVVKRMTIAQMIIMAFGLKALQLGECLDGTPFNNLDINKDIIVVLKAMGYTSSGKRKMISGMTGKKMESEIFMAPIFYQRLKHLTVNKISGRETGYYSQKTKQPGKGRSKKGGFKLGDMESDALSCHNAHNILREKFFEHSDGFECFISEETNEICVGNSKDHIYKDKKSNTKIAKVYLPWVFMMFYFLVETTGINMEFILER